MLNLKVSVKGLDASEDITLDTLRRVLMKSMFKMEELAIQKAPFDLGELRQKITVFPRILNNEYVLTSTAKHSRVMEYGSRPFYAPIKPLKEWAARKLGDENIAYAIRAKIARVGVTAHPFFRPAFFEVKHIWLPQIAALELSSN